VDDCNAQKAVIARRCRPESVGSLSPVRTSLGAIVAPSSPYAEAIRCAAGATVRNAWSRSSRMSCGCSIPTLSRIVSGRERPPEAAPRASFADVSSKPGDLRAFAAVRRIGQRRRRGSAARSGAPGPTPGTTAHLGDSAAGFVFNAKARVPTSVDVRCWRAGSAPAAFENPRPWWRRIAGYANSFVNAMELDFADQLSNSRIHSGLYWPDRY
jgi:hypothetical protein